MFKPSPPRICVICQRSERAHVDQFLRKFFFHGVRLPPPRYKGKPSKNYFEKGFCQKYALETVHYEYFSGRRCSADAYHKACQEALEKHGNGQPWDLALIQIDEAFQRLPPRVQSLLRCQTQLPQPSNPGSGIQDRNRTKMGQPLGFCLNNMGLATYAKLGGIPWLLKAKSIGAHELVIGLGSAEVGEGRLGKRERFVGITTIFGGDGNYHLSNLSKAVSVDEYQEALLKTLRTAIDNVRTGMNWQPGDRVLLVFHANFKRFSNEEVQAVARSDE